QITHILVRVEGDGVVGWGECACPSDPYYCPETTETCWHILTEFLAPAVIGRTWETIGELVRFYGLVKGNNFARAGPAMAYWEARAHREEKPLASLLGGTLGEIASGVSLGIEREVGALYELIDQYLAEGYRRIKLKIAPGWDVDVVRKVRQRYPDVP